MRVSLLLVLAGYTAGAFGQAAYTATRDLSFSVFALGSRVKTDYGSEDHGVTFGVDAVRHFHRLPLFDAGLEARYGIGSGAVVGERTLFIGPRLERRVGRLHLYGDVLFGRGSLGYAGSTTSGGAFAYGGGVDVDLTPHVGLKFDYSQESWKLPTEIHRLTPGKLSAGVVWRFNVGGGPR